MINLLPGDYKKEVSRVYHTRILTIVSGATGVLFAIGSIFLIPALVHVISKEHAIKDQIAVSQKVASAVSGKDIEARTQAFANELRLLKRPDADNSQLADWIAAILERKKSNVTIETIRYEKSPGGLSGVQEIVLRGKAPDRPTLLDFTEALKAEPLFKKVDLPITDLVRSNNILYSITLLLDTSKLKSTN